MLKGVGTSLGVVFLLFLIGLGEWGWLAFVVFWTGVWVVRLFPRWPLGFPLVAGVAILGLHAVGHKFYGSPRLIDNRPVLEHAWTLDHVEMPNVLVATDGSRHPLSGIIFRDMFDRIPAYEQARMFDHAREPLRFAKASDVPGGYVAEKRWLYWCGNTWFPNFFPRRLPSHGRVSINEVLRDYATKPALPDPKPGIDLTHS